MRIRRKVLASEIHYLDPADCGSTIGYAVVKGRRLSASVTLSDCNRQIEWWFGKDVPIAKVEIAIQTLQNFKDALNNARGKRTKKTNGR
jgi:hypothetical protein